jgi:hypothetical protein
MEHGERGELVVGLGWEPSSGLAGCGIFFWFV